MSDSKFTVREKIGEGTFGNVYKATENETGDTVAIKVCRPEHYELRDSGVPTALLREISLMKELKHPNIVTLHGQEIKKDKFLLIFEYMQANLSDYV